MKVTDIKSLASRAGLYRVYIDDKPLGYLAASDISSLELAINKDISNQDYEKIIRQVKYTALYYDALRYADRRLHSRSEVAFFLSSKGSDNQVTEKIINRLEKLGIIDEQKLAAAFIHDVCLKRPMSRKALEIKLRHKQLPQDLIDTELDHLNQNDQQSLDLLIERKAKLSAYANNQTKFFRYLLRQGFSYEDIVTRIGRPKTTK